MIDNDILLNKELKNHELPMYGVCYKLKFIM